ncbi:outer membrane lipoprotein SlyB [Modicisalibacter ilicicola DSM 19980]|uniref:Outer membrane lipoprotein SlyB n=1 Tax=Modicisalibacter ilicicola DSM 19980 TaxID=1121942 RepID=A0A1M4Y8E3_9GAMM|nr:glycine zipper 2TM domain-containing protein [Halomonas ilicicola]SHF02074.1 outer membrane lipoprotein SlyB [Halomonas ilicicola DSM 19980]
MKPTRYLSVLALGLLTLGGCANSDLYSGDVYRGSQAKTGQSVTYGTIVALRPVRIQADDQNSGVIGGLGGAVIGGLLGNQIGGGSGQTIATAAGAIGGSVAGKKIEDRANQANAWEMEVRRDTGDTVIVVQKADRDWQVGQRVRLIGSGANMSVAPY